jgi:hypothetical protein
MNGAHCVAFYGQALIPCCASICNLFSSLAGDISGWQFVSRTELGPTDKQIWRQIMTYAADREGRAL